MGSYTDQIPAYAQSGNTSPSGSSGSEGVLPLTAIHSDDANNSNSISNGGTNPSPHGSPGGGPTAAGTPGHRESRSSMASTSSSKLFASNSSLSNDPPPALPPHLEKVILNNVPSKEDNSILPVPNHVVLNHLYACSVKEGVLSISVTARYRKKYITTVFIKPVVTES